MRPMPGYYHLLPACLALQACLRMGHMEGPQSWAFPGLPAKRPFDPGQTILFYLSFLFLGSQRPRWECFSSISLAVVSSAWRHISVNFWAAIWEFNIVLDIRSLPE